MEDYVPLSHVSIVASVSLCLSMRLASLYIKSPLSVPGKSRQDGSLKAFRAALTALSTSSSDAA
jgi:hypothetical protein